MSIRSECLQADLRISISRLCRLLEVPRSTFYYQPRSRKPTKLNPELECRIRPIIERFPTFGIRRVWAWLRYREDFPVNRKAVARLMRIKGWTVHKRRKGGRPRVASNSIAPKPDYRWATDIASVFCGAKDGWCSFVPVIDCCTRELLGWELARTARTKTAERALEEALLNRFGHLHRAPNGLVLRHDNGLVFGSKQYRRLAAEYGLQQEFITPYSPEENGLCERFIRSFKEECAWLHRFESIDQARSTIRSWVAHYNEERPHQALGYRSPRESFYVFEVSAC